MKKKSRCRIFIMLIMITTIFSSSQASAQNKGTYMRVANIVVDSSKLEAYKAALKEGMAAAISKEPGVLSLSAVYDKENPTHVTVFETYASEDAYKLHIQTPHFKKYKAAVEGMVKSLVLTDVIPIAVEVKK